MLLVQVLMCRSKMGGEGSVRPDTLERRPKALYNSALHQYVEGNISLRFYS